MRTRHCSLHLSAGTRSPPELSTHLAFCACESPGSAAAQWRWMRLPPTAAAGHGAALAGILQSHCPCPAALLLEQHPLRVEKCLEFRYFCI